MSAPSKGTENVNKVANYNEVCEVSILQPLGDSSRMPQEERMKWERWNQEIPKLASMFPNIVYMNGKSVDKVVSLTFDDGPDKHYTPLILDVLKKYNVRASFFVHGNRAKRLKCLVKRMADEGHYIGGHACTHPNLTQITPEEVRAEISGGCDIIYKITNKNPEIIRPPYGELDIKVIQMMNNMDKKIMLWSINTFDWLEKTDTNIVRNVTENIRSGDVVLMHSYTNKRPTLEALPKIIERLQAENYRFLGVDEMIQTQEY